MLGENAKRKGSNRHVLLQHSWAPLHLLKLDPINIVGSNVHPSTKRWSERPDGMHHR